MKGLYIHLPFCRNKCSYCGFYSATDSYEVQLEYFRAMIKDLRYREKRRYDTIYIGGGTPSTADRRMLPAFIDIVSIMNDGIVRETTIEANPDSIDEEFCELVHNYKFSRISIGCQSTDDNVLKKLTRIHSSEDVFRSYDMIRRKCPNVSVNLDIMFDIPYTDRAQTEKTLKDVISMSPDHVSAYNYSFDTGFLAGGENDDTDFELVTETITDAGYGKYEISNFARAGHESRHNINYWELGDYDGIGASSWTLQNTDGKRIYKGRTSDINKYIKDPLTFSEVDSSEDPATFIERLVFGLRMTKGVASEFFIPVSDAELADKIYNLLKELSERELVSWDGQTAKLTKQGELYLDYVQSLFWELLP